MHLVDIELQSATAMKVPDFNKIRAHAGLILSYHDFKTTKKLEETFASMKEYPADIYKLVSTATKLHDNVLMMRFLEEASHNHKMVGICMGEQGINSRVLSLRAGSLFTFGSLSPGEETAPGQVTAKALRDLYRIENVDAATRVYGVAGDPIEHSLSPQMMNAAFRRENLNSVYLALHAKSLDDLMKCARDSHSRHEHHYAVQAGHHQAARQLRAALPESGRLQYGHSFAGWQALRLQH